jgi:hypothetical protein
MNIISAIPKFDAFANAAVDELVIPLLENEREKAIARYSAELLEDNYTVSDETTNLPKLRWATKILSCGGDHQHHRMLHIMGRTC